MRHKRWTKGCPWRRCARKSNVATAVSVRPPTRRCLRKLAKDQTTLLTPLCRSLTLTKLAARGVGPIPLSNGFDNHGRYITYLTRQDGISAVIGYLHKVLPTPNMTPTPRGHLLACLTHEIPVLLTDEKSDQEKARRLLGKVADLVQLADPSDVYQVVLQIIS